MTVAWEFTDIAEALAPKGLCPPNLNILKPDAAVYEAMAIQPKGPPVLKDEHVGSADRKTASEKFDGFLELAATNNADLVLCPEYSCPWSSLERILGDGPFPAEGKLWALGCESITPSELSDLEGRTSGIVWIHEPVELSSRVFLDPVCYLFTAQTGTKEGRRVAVLQFKSDHMGGNDYSERDCLILGSKRYFLRNRDRDYIRLITVLCSDALNFGFDEDTVAALQMHPTVILHLQLVDDTRHPAMRRYRSDLFANQCSEKVEVFSLNWARELANDQAPARRGNSCYFMKSGNFVYSDERLETNHRLGLYYSRWQAQRTELCSFNYDEHVFHFANFKPSLFGSAAQLNRTGPEMCGIWDWNAASGRWDSSPRADDGFGKLCESYQDDSLTACTDDSARLIDVERLITLTAGQLDPVSDWHDVRKMRSFAAEADERTKRLTFVQEQSVDSQTFRRECVGRYVVLVSTILPKGELIPPCIEDLSGNFRVVPPAEANRYRWNIVPASEDGPGATGVFLGLQPPGAAKEFLDKLRAAWGDDPNFFREERSRRLVVWYQHPSGGIHFVSPPLPTITDESDVPGSIAAGTST
jgi:hypothetical protein